MAFNWKKEDLENGIPTAVLNNENTQTGNEDSILPAKKDSLNYFTDSVTEKVSESNVSPENIDLSSVGKEPPATEVGHSETINISSSTLLETKNNYDEEPIIIDNLSPFRAGVFNAINVIMLFIFGLFSFRLGYFLNFNTDINTLSWILIGFVSEASIFILSLGILETVRTLIISKSYTLGFSLILLGSGFFVAAQVFTIGGFNG